MSEEQPQQDDHRNRHTQEPEQNSSSHSRLLELLNRVKNAGTSREVPATDETGFRNRRAYDPMGALSRVDWTIRFTSDPCSAWTPTAPPEVSRHPFAKVRPNADRVNG